MAMGGALLEDGAVIWVEGVAPLVPDYIDEVAHREGASPARRRHCKASSEGLNLERKEETVEMWLLMGGGGGDLDISAIAEN